VIVFLDTEFTTLQSPNLLSLGMVTSDGREHYVELDLHTQEGRSRRQQASEFVKSTVFKMWGAVPGANCDAREMGSHTAGWLLSLAKEASAPIRIAYDFWADFALLQSCVRNVGLWNRIEPLVVPVHLPDLMSTERGRRAAEESFQELRGRGIGPHHALADAVALRAAYEANTQL
jgi:hypothetical protein